MKDEIKEIYLSSSEWTKTHDNMGRLIANVIFKDNISSEEYHRFFKNTYFVLCSKDYITNLQEEYRQTRLLKERYQLEKENYKSRLDKVLELIENDYFEDGSFENYYEVLKLLKGEE